MRSYKNVGEQINVAVLLYCGGADILFTYDIHMHRIKNIFREKCF